MDDYTPEQLHRARQLELNRNYFRELRELHKDVKRWLEAENSLAKARAKQEVEWRETKCEELALDIEQHRNMSPEEYKEQLAKELELLQC